MAYVVHVTRAGDWTQSLEVPIPLDAWQGLFRNTDGFEPSDPASEGGASVLWTGHPRGKDVVLHFEGGRVWVSDPDVPTLELLVRHARALKATVVGDDGEVYSANPAGDLVIDGVESQAYSQTGVLAISTGDNRGSVLPIAFALVVGCAVLWWRLQS